MSEIVLKQHTVPVSACTALALDTNAVVSITGSGSIRLTEQFCFVLISDAKLGKITCFYSGEHKVLF
jgi:hypothetical protein